MSRKVIAKLVTVVTIVAVIVAGVWLWHVQDSKRQQTSKRQIELFETSLVLGLSRASVVRVYTSGGYDSFELDDAHPDQWLAKAPFTIGAQNWFLVLVFTEDRLTCIRYRTEDNLQSRPLSAPADRCS